MCYLTPLLVAPRGKHNIEQHTSCKGRNSCTCCTPHANCGTCSPFIILCKTSPAVRQESAETGDCSSHTEYLTPVKSQEMHIDSIPQLPPKPVSCHSCMVQPHHDRIAWRMQQLWFCIDQDVSAAPTQHCHQVWGLPVGSVMPKLQPAALKLTKLATHSAGS